MAPLRLVSLGARAAGRRWGLLGVAWLLHIAFAVLATWPVARVFSASLAHRPEASGAFLNGFSLDLLVDWHAAYGAPLALYFGAALGLAVVYAAAGVILEAALLPAYLAPFERFGRGRLLRQASQALPGLAAVALGSLPLWALVWLTYREGRAAIQWVAAGTESEVWPTILLAVAAAATVAAAALLRILLNLWKCARVAVPPCGTGPAAGLREALAAALRRKRAVAALAGATLSGMLLYAATAGAAGLFAVATSHVTLAIALQQVVIFGAVALRLWLLAACTVLWRSSRG